MHGPLRAQIAAHSQVIKTLVWRLAAVTVAREPGKPPRVRSNQPPQGELSGGVARARSRPELGSLASKTRFRRLAPASVDGETGKTSKIIIYIYM